jgi:hypothetical protein
MEGRSMHILLLNVFCHYPQSLFLFPIAWQVWHWYQLQEIKIAFKN